MQAKTKTEQTRPDESIGKKKQNDLLFVHFILSVLHWWRWLFHSLIAVLSFVSGIPLIYLIFIVQSAAISQVPVSCQYLCVSGVFLVCFICSKLMSKDFLLKPRSPSLIFTFLTVLLSIKCSLTILVLMCFGDKSETNRSLHQKVCF